MMFRDSVLDGSVDFSVLTTSFQVQRLALSRLQLDAFLDLHVPICLISGLSGLYRHWLISLPLILLSLL